MILEFSTGSLRIGRENDAWCQVTLVIENMKFSLGAQPLSYLKKNIIVFLSSPPESIRWVLSLSEQHFSIYGVSNLELGVKFLVQDSNARTIAEFTLSGTERNAWLEVLQEKAIG